jgi:hypothetical protein
MARSTRRQAHRNADSSRSVPITSFQAICAVRVVGHGMARQLWPSLRRPTNRSGAAYQKQPIRGFPPSACLPCQAWRKAPDRLLAPSAYLPFQARRKAPDRLLAPSAYLPFQARRKAPAGLLCSQRRRCTTAQIALLKRWPEACTDGRYASNAIARWRSKSRPAGRTRRPGAANSARPSATIGSSAASSLAK